MRHENDLELFEMSAGLLLRALNTPVFAAGFDNSSAPVLYLHLADKQRAAILKDEIRRAKSRLAISVKHKIRIHNPAHLGRAASLAELVLCFNHDRIIWDPTGSITRSICLLKQTAQLRKVHGTDLRSVSVDSWMRTLYLQLDRNSLFNDGKWLKEKSQEFSDSIDTIFRDEDDGGITSFKMGFENVGMSLTSVDAIPSDYLVNKMASPKKILQYTATSIALLLGTTSPWSSGAAASEVGPGNTSLRGGYEQTFVPSSRGELVEEMLGPVQKLANRYSADTEARSARSNSIADIQRVAVPDSDHKKHIPASDSRLQWYGRGDAALPERLGANRVKQVMGGGEDRSALVTLSGLAVFADGAVQNDDVGNAIFGFRYYVAEESSLAEELLFPFVDELVPDLPGAYG